MKQGGRVTMVELCRMAVVVFATPAPLHEHAPPPPTSPTLGSGLSPRIPLPAETIAPLPHRPHDPLAHLRIRHPPAHRPEVVLDVLDLRGRGDRARHRRMPDQELEEQLRPAR